MNNNSWLSDLVFGLVLGCIPITLVVSIFTYFWLNNITQKNHENLEALANTFLRNNKAVVDTYDKLTNALKFAIDSGDQFEADGYKVQIGKDQKVHIQFTRKHETNKELIYVKNITLPRYLFTDLTCKASIQESYKNGKK